MMAKPKCLALCRIRSPEWLKWKLGEIVNDGGRLKIILLEYNVEIPIDEIYEGGVEIVEIMPPLDEEFGEVE
jgi:hypothetical protein